MSEWIGNQLPREVVDYCIQVLEDWEWETMGDFYNGEFSIVDSGLANHNFNLFGFCEILIGLPEG